MDDQPLPFDLLQAVRQAEGHLSLAAVLRDAGHMDDVMGEAELPIGRDVEIAHLRLVRPRILREEVLEVLPVRLRADVLAGGMQSKTKRLSLGT